MIDITYCPGQLIWNKAEVHNVLTSLLIFVIKFITCTYVTTDPMDCYVKVGSSLLQNCEGSLNTWLAFNSIL